MDDVAVLACPMKESISETNNRSMNQYRKKAINQSMSKQ